VAVPNFPNLQGLPFSVVPAKEGVDFQDFFSFSVIPVQTGIHPFLVLMDARWNIST
jgi:hypothetical protein